MWTKIALITSVLINVCMLLTTVSLANKVFALEHQLHEARAELDDRKIARSDSFAKTEVPVIQVSPAAPPIKVAVPMPLPKPTAHPPAKLTPRVVRAKHHYRDPRRVIKCSEVPMQAYWATSKQVTDYMWKNGATRKQIKQVLTCVGSG